jgi:competence protein ComEC
MRLFCKIVVFGFLLTANIILAQASMKIYCIDVNTGSSTLIVSPTNKYVLVDAGMTNYGNSTVAPFIRSLGITHLDYTIATHYHEDHIGGMDEVIYNLSGFGSNDSILNWCYDRGDSTPPSNNIYTGYASAAGTKRRVIGLGETLDLGGGAFMFCIARNGTVLNGVGVTPSSGENYRSCAFILVWHNFRLYVGGDLTGNPVSGDPAVEPNAAPFTGDVNVYVVNHHGGRNSSVNVFLDSLRPETAIFSQGTVPSNNNHPHQESIDRLVAHNTYMYQMNDNPTGGVIPTGHGRILNTTAVITAYNTFYTINGDYYIYSGVLRDGACLEIYTPQDTIAEGTIISPVVMVKNFGNTNEIFPVRCKIGPGYNRIQTISNLAPDDTMSVTFDTAWYAMRGNYEVFCSTEVYGDISLVVAYYDNEIEQILTPAMGSVSYFSDTIVPKVIFKDNSEFANPALVKIYCLIRNQNTVYIDSLQKISNPGITDTLFFSPMPIIGLSEGIYACSVWVERSNDLSPENNSQATQFTILDPNSISEPALSSPVLSHMHKIIEMRLYNVTGQMLSNAIFYNTTENLILKGTNWFGKIPPGIYFIHSTGMPIDKKYSPHITTRKLVILPNN